MSHVSANVPVVDNLLSRFRFTSYNSIVEARVLLAQHIRLSMQHPQAYQIPIDQQLPPTVGTEAIAQYVHPWNVACALVNVCLNGPRFGGAELAPQEDLMLYVADWTLLGQLSFPSAVVPLGEPAPIIEKADPAGMAPPPPAPEPTLTLAGRMAEPDVQPETPVNAVQSEPAAAAEPLADPVATGAPRLVHDDAQSLTHGLPDPDIRAERKGQTGRPQKSPFEKKIEERNKIAPPPFWWEHLVRSAPYIFTRNPAGALDNSSTGAGPVQSYMVLLALLRRVLQDVPGSATVADLRQHLKQIDDQVTRIESAAAANQIRAKIVPATGSQH